MKHHDAKAPITFTSEDLAVPEVHVGHISKEKPAEDTNGEVLYDNVAIPEIRPSFGERDEKE